MQAKVFILLWFPRWITVEPSNPAIPYSLNSQFAHKRTDAVSTLSKILLHLPISQERNRFAANAHLALRAVSWVTTSAKVSRAQ